MDKHTQIQEDLVAYLLGELPEQEMHAVEEHIASCTPCAKLLDAYRATLQADDALPRLEPRRDFPRRVLAAAREASRDLDEVRRRTEQDDKPRIFLEWLTLRSLRTAIKLAAIAAIVTLIVLVPWRQTDKGVDDTDVADTAGTTAEPSDSAARHVRAEQPTLKDTSISGIDPTLQIDIGPIGIDEPPQPLPPEDRFSEPIDNLLVQRTEMINPAYLSRVDWPLKRQRMREAGAGSEAANAIVRGLWWLARHQDADGKWDAAGYAAHCRGSRDCAEPAHAVQLSNEAVTGAALLALLGDGNTPQRRKFGTHVTRAVQWLLSRQQPNGAIGDERAPHFIIGHAIAAAALAEVSGMTNDTRLTLAAQKAADYLVARDIPILDEKSAIRADNLAAAAARLAALNIAQTAHLRLPQEIARKASAAIAEAERRLESYSASPDPAATTTMATGMVALLSSIDGLDNSPLQAGTLLLRSQPLDWTTGGQVYWLCGSAIMKRNGGDLWLKWNAALQKTLLRNQAAAGHAIGSWAPSGPEAKLGGRVFSTALSILALETPYR